jgi:hypothetical protein
LAVYLLVMCKEKQGDMTITDDQANDYGKYARNPDNWMLAARRNLTVAQLLMKRARELQLLANHDSIEFSGCYYAGYFHAAERRSKNGAGDGSRTRDPKLGKLVLYQLSYARFSISIIAAAILVVN